MGSEPQFLYRFEVGGRMFHTHFPNDQDAIAFALGLLRVLSLQPAPVSAWRQEPGGKGEVRIWASLDL